MAKETKAERRARARAENVADAQWEADKPMRLLNAHGLAQALSLTSAGVLLRDDILYYYFPFQDYDPAMDTYYDPVVELGPTVMQNIENDLAAITATIAAKARKEKLRQETLARLTAEEREALGY